MSGPCIELKNIILPCIHCRKNSEKSTEIIPSKVIGPQLSRIENLCNFANKEKIYGKQLFNSHNLEHIKDFLPLTYKINHFINLDFVHYSIVLLLLYHIFLYIYLGIVKQGGAFYTGIMFSIMYSGALISYWVTYRKKTTLLNWSNVFPSELVSKSVEKKDIIQKNIIEEDENQKKLFKDYVNNYNSYYNPIAVFHFMNENMRYLYTCKNAQISFLFYCNFWEKKACKIIYLLWDGIATFLIICKILPSHIVDFGKSFDDELIGLWGYYNLFGQYIASIGIVTASTIAFTSFYQLHVMILGYVEKIRQYKYRNLKIEEKHLLSYDRFYSNQTSNLTLNDFKDETGKIIEHKLINYKFRQMREEYLYLQSCSITLSELWSMPIGIIILFCTEVIISNIYVINYQLTKCGTHHHHNEDVSNSYCDFFIGFAFVWLSAALGFAGLLLHSISAINTAAAKIKNAFIYSDDGLLDNIGETEIVKSDYHIIGGRQKWIDYIESNPLQFSVFGITITSKFVVNTTYAIATTLGTFLSSYIFADNDEE